MALEWSHTRRQISISKHKHIRRYRWAPRHLCAWNVIFWYLKWSEGKRNGILLVQLVCDKEKFGSGYVVEPQKSGLCAGYTYCTRHSAMMHEIQLQAFQREHSRIFGIGARPEFATRSQSCRRNMQMIQRKNATAKPYSIANIRNTHNLYNARHRSISVNGYWVLYAKCEYAWMTEMKKESHSRHRSYHHPMPIACAG